MRVWINGKLSAFQAADMGSIPITRFDTSQYHVYHCVVHGV